MSTSRVGYLHRVTSEPGTALAEEGTQSARFLSRWFSLSNVESSAAHRDQGSCSPPGGSRDGYEKTKGVSRIMNPQPSRSLDPSRQ